MKKIYIVTLLIILKLAPLVAQNSIIEGTIQSKNNVNYLSGISVYLEGTNLGTSTNNKGKYFINRVPSGTYTVVVSAIGYITIKEKITIKTGEILKKNFSITEMVSTLSEVKLITGGKSRLKDIPGSVHYISPKELQKFGFTDINRTLQAIPGVNIQEEDGFGLFPNIGLRGTGVERNTKITVMEDGVLIAPAPYAAPAAYYFPTIGRMQGIEILKGSSQIKYGPYTTGGAINLISTQIPNEFSGKINFLGGSFGTKNLHATVGNTQHNFGFLVETFQFSSDGFKELDSGINSGINKNAGFTKQDYLAKFRIKTDKNAKIFQALDIKIGYATAAINETYLGLTEEDFKRNPLKRYAGSQVDNITSKQSQLSLTHFIKFSDFFKISTVAYKTSFKRNWYKLDKVKDNAGNKIKINEILENPIINNNAYSIINGANSVFSDALFVKANNRTYFSKGIQTELNFNFKTSNITHKIDFGIRIHQDQIDRFQWVDEYAMENSVMKLTKAGEYGTESNRIETANAFASYIQYQLKFGKLTATPGIRYENIKQQRKDYGIFDTERTGINLTQRSNTVAIFIPGIGLSYNYNKHLNLFTGVHKGFAPPGSKEELKPEESINYELGIRYNKKSLSTQTVLFFNDYSNLLGTDLEATGGGGTNEQFNGGNVHTKGVEFQISYDLLATKESLFRLPFTFSYTYTNATFLNDFLSDFDGWNEVSAGDQFPYLANHQFSFFLSLEHHLFQINFNGRYIGTMRTIPGQGKIQDSEKINAYFILDTSINYFLSQNIAIFANATNLTNKTYVVAKRPAGLRPGMPKAYNIGLKINF